MNVANTETMSRAALWVAARVCGPACAIWDRDSGARCGPRRGRRIYLLRPGRRNDGRQRILPLAWRFARSTAYAALIFATLVWAIWEVGLDGWGLVARLATVILLGLPLLARSLRGSRNVRPSVWSLHGSMLFVGALVAAVLLGSGNARAAVGPGKAAHEAWHAGQGAGETVATPDGDRATATGRTTATIWVERDSVRSSRSLRRTSTGSKSHGRQTSGRRTPVCRAPCR